MFQKPNPRQSFPDLELEVLEYWKKNGTFKKSLVKNKGREEYVFYDGPPFATGLPHYGHILAGTLKDVIPRYQTMRGKYVARRWGWDCHGLPVENLVEKELELADKQAIEDFGVSQFNEACRASVLRYTKEWGKVVDRMGRWVDFEDSYKTMSPDYMESIWWVFKSLWDKDLIYKGKKSMHVCPRCVTPLSNFEVGQGYKDVTDFSVTAKFKVDEDDAVKLFGSSDPLYILAWTTTPWTLPGNLALAVSEKLDYVVIETNGEKILLAEGCLETYSKEITQALNLENFDQFDKEVCQKINGKGLVGMKYSPLFDFPHPADESGVKNEGKEFTVLSADFVSDESGTGIVHIAPGYGEDDMNLAKGKTPMLQHVVMNGSFVDGLGPEFAQHNIVGADNKRKADEFVASELQKKGFFFSKESYRHSYPHCWRCDTPLINYATDSWYVNIDKVKKKMVDNNQKINWVPDHLKDGRFGKWLDGARDWAISRNRFWGAPLPVWEGESGTIECIGSIADLRSRLDKRFTKITLVRHAQSEGNTIGLRQSIPPGTGLTPAGETMAKEAGKKCKEIHNKEPFDLILHSPMLRTQQTAEMIAAEMGAGIPLQVEETIGEIAFGKVEGKRDVEIQDYVKERWSKTHEEHFKQKCGETGESHEDVTKRALEFIKKMITERPGQSIMVVTHSDVVRFLLRELNEDSLELLYSKEHYPMCQPKELYFDNETGKLVDLHKHFVDDMTYTHPKTGETMKRIPEVLDCWFESGSMPYAQAHYPFENKERFEATFPANFIAEGLDQTRGWFYTLVVLSASLFDKPAFQNVIVNGIILAEDGQKMSKSKKNYPDPKIIFDGYGADAMRFYLMNSPVVKADDMRFAEKGVEEVVRSVFLPLWNAYSFLLTYAEIDDWKPKGQIYLVRHGQTDVNKAHKWQGSMDEPLNHTGIQQIETLREQTKNLPLDVLISSDYIRAKHTADIINADFDLEIEVSTEFREQHFGEFEGVSFAETIAEHGSEKNAVDKVRENPNGGETREAFEKRVVAKYEELKEKHAGKNMMIVAHGGVYMVLRKHTLGVKTWEEYFEKHFLYAQNGSLHLFETTEFEPTHELDRWIISELFTLTKEMTNGFESYDLNKALDPLVRYIDSLTNWYIRRSRRRFWKSESDTDKSQAYQTLYTVLVETCKLLAPFAPFITEAMYRNLTGLESVHLAEWPEIKPGRIDEDLNQEIGIARQIVALGHAARAKARVKVRQPLGQIEVALPPAVDRDLIAHQLDVIQEELNVKEIIFLDSVEGKVKVIVKPNGKLLGPKLGKEVQSVIKEAKNGNYTQLDNGNYKVLEHELTPEEIEIAYESLDAGADHLQIESDQGMVVILDTTITPELQREGYARDIVRAIQDLRKKADLNVADRIIVGVTTDDTDVQTALTEHLDYIQKETLATEVTAEKQGNEWESVLKLGEHGVVVSIRQ
ncbi:MAG: class I tRNA ligase family protein [Candidatus Gracilibacteria bacterium]|nr:class I tRNA ligase family protein [Candidatus Gracilibacteria bacterium]